MSDTTRTREMDPVGDAAIGNHLATRLAWSLWAACVVLIALAILLDLLTYNPLFPGERLGSLGPGLAVLTGVLALVYPTVGAVVASRLPGSPIGWIFCIMGLLYAVRRSAMAYAGYAFFENLAMPWGEYAAWLSSWVGFSGLILAGVLLALLFPNGRLPSRRWRPVVWIAVLGAAMTAFAHAFTPGDLSTHYYTTNPFGLTDGPDRLFASFGLFHLGTSLMLASGLAALLSLVIRLRRASGGERQQLKWFLFAAAPAIICLTLWLLQISTVAFTTDVLFDTANLLPWEVFRTIRYAAVFALLVLPVFTYIAILRHRLYDIDLLINRTLVYGTLTACVVGIYVLAVGGLGILLQAQGSPGVALTATGVVAVLFQPLRDRLQRGANRLMYGERDDPYAVLSRLGRGLEEALVPEAVLSTVVETIAQALKLPYAAILLKEGDGFETAAAHGSPAGEPEALPLVYGREEIGRLVLSPRAPGEGFSDADRRLLEDFARHAEVAVHAVRLTADLQRSREQLVATREEERRRLRRDLHDGLGPTLASLALKLDATRKLVRRRPGDAEELLTNLKEQTQETVIDVRRLVYGLRPPALDDLGLIPALRQQAGNQGFSERNKGNGVGFSIEAPEELSSLPAAVEVAAYRIAQEALTNVARHARAGSCHIRLSVDAAGGTMDLEIRDDGVGMPEGRRAGIGLSSMRERAEELGGTCDVGPAPDGGTLVLARLPLNVSKKTHEGAPSWAAPSASS